jgi:hypothetical protein
MVSDDGHTAYVFNMLLFSFDDKNMLNEIFVVDMDKLNLGEKSVEGYYDDIYLEREILVYAYGKWVKGHGKFKPVIHEKLGGLVKAARRHSKLTGTSIRRLDKDIKKYAKLLTRFESSEASDELYVKLTNPPI